MQQFDQYGYDYKAVVQQSIDFAGLEYEFFVKAKSRMIKQVAVTKRFDPAANTSLLDVGCGVGSLHGHLADSFGRICGVDPSEKSLAIAKERNPKFEYQIMKGASIPYPSAVFDMVTAINVLHHVNPTAWQVFVFELKRVLRPNGVVCIIEHNPFNPLTRLAVFRCPFDKDAHLLRAAQARRLLQGAGLVQIRSRYFLVSPFSSEPAYRVERWLSAVPIGAQYIAAGERSEVDTR